MEVKYSLKDIKKTLTHRISVSAALVYNPLSIGLVWIIANFTKITPNQITYIDFLVGLSSAWCFFQGAPFYLILGALLFGFAIVLDWTDGKLARLKNKESAVGLFLDSALGSVILSLNILALTYGQFRVTGQEIFLVLGIAIFSIYFMLATFGVAKKDAEDSHVRGEAKSTTEADRYNFLGKLKGLRGYFRKKGILPFFNFDEAHTLIFIIGPIFGIIKECLLLTLLFGLLTLIFYLVVFIKDLSRLRSNHNR